MHRTLENRKKIRRRRNLLDNNYSVIYIESKYLIVISSDIKGFEF